MQSRFKSLLSVVLSSHMLTPIAGLAQEVPVLPSTLSRVTQLAFTESLPDADRIELFTIAVDWESTEFKQADPTTLSKDRFLLGPFRGTPSESDRRFVDVESHVTITGNRCKAIVATWRALKFRPNGAFCHTPPYGMRFYRDKELLFETTVCWQCHNFYLPEYNVDSGEVGTLLYGFDNDQNAKKLLKLLAEALPTTKPKNAAHK